MSPDGDRVYYAAPNIQKRMTTLQISINGGEPSAVADNYQSSGAIDGETPALLSDLKNVWLFDFAVSPDYKQIIFAHGSQFNEAVLIENFTRQ